MRAFETSNFTCAVNRIMLMLNAIGESYLLIVPSENTLLSQYEIAVEMGAPKTIGRAKSNKVVPYFWRNRGITRVHRLAQ
jgi:hypothetical protein